MRRIAGLFPLSLAAVVTFTSLAGCGRHDRNEHFYLIATNTRLAYWQTAAAGLRTAAQEYGVQAEMQGPTTFDPQGEVDAFRAAVAQKPAGILVSVADPDLMNPEIDHAIASGVPVITIDSDAPDSRRLYFIGTNNLQAGRLGGERAAAQMNGHGNVVFFTNPQQPNLQERLKGYQDVFGRFPGIKVVEVYDIQGEPSHAMQKATEYAKRTGPGRIDAFVCLEAGAGKGVADAMNEATGGERRELVTMDVDSGILALIGQGTVDATIGQKPYTMAYLGLIGLDAIHHNPHTPMAVDSADRHSPYPAFVDTGTSLIDKGNVAIFEKNQ